MIPTSSPVEKWLLHVVGDQELRPKEGMRRLTEAVELNTEAPQILSTFGRKEFEGMVGFVDMQGFSSHAQGKSPREVLAIAQPFVDAVVDVAKKRQWLVDKTIGDEVMVVCPLYGDDAHLAEVDLLARDDPIIEAANLVSDILVRFRTDHIADHISAGFACGRLLLARVGTSEYGEWTCYGNAVNTAKRLQGVPRPGDANGTHWLVIGSGKDEGPTINQRLDIWLRIWPATGCLRLVSPKLKTESLKGVGETVFVATGVTLKDGY